ncbi:MAG: ATP-binding protein [bacterium]
MRKSGEPPAENGPAGGPSRATGPSAPRPQGRAPSSLSESRRANRRFRYLTLTWTALTLALLLGLSYKVYIDAKKDIEERFNRQQLLLAEQASGRIASFLGGLTASLRYSAVFLRTIGPNHPGRMSAIAGLYDRLGGRARVSEVGYLRESAETDLPATREYRGALARCPAERGTCLLFIQKEGTPFFFLGAAHVAADDWLYAKVTLEDIERSFVRPVQSRIKGRALLFDARGRILIGPGLPRMVGARLDRIAEEMNDADLAGIARRMRAGGRGFGWHKDFRPGKRGKGRRHLTAFAPLRVGDEQWSLAVTAPSSKVVDLVRRTFRKGFILTGFGFIVIISAALLILDRERRRIRAEDNLIWSSQVLESKRRLQALFDGITDSICILDREMRILMLNRGMARLLGGEIADLLGRPWGGEGDTLIPEPLADRSLIAGAFESGRRGSAECAVPQPDGKRLDLEVNTYPIFDASGETVQVILYLNDVTEQRELQRQLIQSDRLSIVGKMSAQVAHEVRNPLSAINLNAELLEDELRRFEGMDTAEAWSLLRSIKAEVDILRQVVDDYLRFVRMPRSDPHPGDINEVLDELLNFHAEEAASREVVLVREFSGSLPDVEMDEAQMRAAIQNLILNAFDAMPQGGRLILRTRPAEGDAAGVDIDVIDSGVGIRSEDQASLFTPFFTTKANGTGLGLAFTQQVVREHRGSIRFASRENEGTTFHVRLPAAAHEEIPA